MNDILLNHRDQNIETVTLNRPQKLNALSIDLWQQVANCYQLIYFSSANLPAFK